MRWTMDPDRYVCPDHGIDLTAEVRGEALAEPSVVVSGRGATDTGPADSLWAGHSPAGPFLVVVTCPGDAPAPEARPHEVAFEGAVR